MRLDRPPQLHGAADCVYPGSRAQLNAMDEIDRFRPKDAEALIAAEGWKVESIVAQDGFYLCDCGCEYVRVYAKVCGDDALRSLGGFFGEMAFDDGDVRGASALAKKIGVPLVQLPRSLEV